MTFCCFELVIGFLDVHSGLVKCISQVIDRPSVANLQFLVEFPRIGASRRGHFRFGEVDVPAQDPAALISSPAEPIASALSRSASVSAQAPLCALPDMSRNRASWS